MARQFNLIPPIAEQAEYNLFQREKVELQMPELYHKIGERCWHLDTVRCGIPVSCSISVRPLTTEPSTLGGVGRLFCSVLGSTARLWPAPSAMLREHALPRHAEYGHSVPLQKILPQKHVSKSAKFMTKGAQSKGMLPLDKAQIVKSDQRDKHQKLRINLVDCVWSTTTSCAPCLITQTSETLF